MRIIVTRTGEQVINSLTVDNEELMKNRRDLSRSKILNNSNSHLDKSNNTIQTNLIPVVQKKNVKINTNKILLPKFISDNYNSDDMNNDKSFLKNLNLNLGGGVTNNKKNHSHNDDSLSKNDFSLREIIPYEAFRNMEKNIKREKEVRNRSCNANHYQLRRPTVDFKDIISEIESKAERKIQSDKIHLINYLNNKNKISDVFIKQIAQYSDERINRINKMSQIFNHSVETQKIYDKIVKSKLQEVKAKESEEYKDSLLNMENYILRSQEIIKRNKRPIDDKERYYFVHQEAQQSWEKHNVDKLYNRRAYNKETENKIPDKIYKS